MHERDLVRVHDTNWLVTNLPVWRGHSGFMSRQILKLEHVHETFVEGCILSPLSLLFFLFRVHVALEKYTNIKQEQNAHCGDKQSKQRYNLKFVS